MKSASKEDYIKFYQSIGKIVKRDGGLRTIGSVRGKRGKKVKYEDRGIDWDLEERKQVFENGYRDRVSLENG